MSERPKGPETVTQTTEAEAPRQRRPGTPGRRSDADAIEPSGAVNPEKLKLNRQRLHVDSEHKTESMKKGKRGTYP